MNDAYFAELASAEGIDRAAQALFGNLPAASGLSHVFSECDGFVPRIGPESPKAHVDSFVLQLSRARSEAILLTGQILRDEKALTLRLPPHFIEWRRRRHLPSTGPTVYVLSRHGGFDHPLQSEATLLLPQCAAASEGWKAEYFEGVEVGDALDHLARRHDCLSIEAGPEVALQCYGAGRVVEVLRCRAKFDLPTSARAGRAPTRAVLNAENLECRSAREVLASDANWSIERWSIERWAN